MAELNLILAGSTAILWKGDCITMNFLEIEKEAAKAHIQDVIEKSEADEVLKYKQKGLFSQLGDFIKSHMHKIKK